MLHQGLFNIIPRDKPQIPSGATVCATGATLLAYKWATLIIHAALCRIFCRTLFQSFRIRAGGWPSQ